MELFQLLVNVRGSRGIADVGVDLASGGDADAHGFQIAVVHIGGNNQVPASDFAGNQLRGNLPAPRYKAHLFGTYAAARPVHLGHIAVTVRRRLLALTLFDPLIPERHNSPSERSHSGRTPSA